MECFNKIMRTYTDDAEEEGQEIQKVMGRIQQ